MLSTTALKTRPRTYNGVFALLIINLVIYLLDHPFGLPLQGLYLNHASPQWHQFITSMFCHASWAHLSGNLFMLYVFGRLVEDEEGPLGVWSSYLVTGFAANLLSWLLLPAGVVSLGASGAVFGLFAVSVLIRLQWSWRRLVEVLILGQFVVSQVLGEIQQVGVADGINRVAHLGGAVAGVILIVGLHRLTARLETK